MSKKNNNKNNKKKKSVDIELEFYEPIEISIEDIEEADKNKFTIRKEFRHIKNDLKNNKGKNLKLIWISLIFLIISIGFFVGYIYMTKSGENVDAIVCDVVETTTQDGKYVEFYEAKLVYAYKDKKYDNVLYKDANDTMKIGDEVKIRINPKKPTKIYSNKGYKEIGLVALAISLIMFVGHFYMAWRKIYLAEDESLG